MASLAAIIADFTNFRDLTPFKPRGRPQAHEPDEEHFPKMSTMRYRSTKLCRSTEGMRGRYRNCCVIAICWSFLWSTSSCKTAGPPDPYGWLSLFRSFGTFALFRYSLLHQTHCQCLAGPGYRFGGRRRVGLSKVCSDIIEEGLAPKDAALKQ